MPTQNRSRLERSLGRELGRELSARTILFHQAIASLAGVAVTDLKCLDYIGRNDRTTAGDLARLTGLTTGSITAAIDRLEAAGLAHRVRDTNDRRKVFLQAQQSPAMAKILPLYEALAADMTGLLKRYSTPELTVIEDFLLRCIEILERNVERTSGVSSARSPTRQRRSTSAP